KSKTKKNVKNPENSQKQRIISQLCRKSHKHTSSAHSMNCKGLCSFVSLYRTVTVMYFCPLTLDPNTANAWLHLSERNKKVIFWETVSPCPDHPDRFDWWFQVLCQEALSRTRCYWEVEWSGEGAAMGVTYKGIRRQGDGHECRLGFNDQSWILSCSHFSCSLWHSETKTEISVPPSQRIGLHLDYSAGSLSFYSISDTMTLIHRFNATFTEPLYAGFWVGQNSSVTICPL
uniref:B30.2/SPRY domain-containing protein n=1 Tax=Erpetoichthys calabaricus TaxID=27687 RepID=A0A8C4TI90_ERPCA